MHRSSHIRRVWEGVPTILTDALNTNLCLKLLYWRGKIVNDLLSIREGIHIPNAEGFGWRCGVHFSWWPCTKIKGVCLHSKILLRVKKSYYKGFIMQILTCFWYKSLILMLCCDGNYPLKFKNHDSVWLL